jgi:hypothetical protein
MMECRCFDGREGRCECATEDCAFCLEACSCEHCPSFAPEPRQPFDACGGDLLGAWATSVFPVGDLNMTRVYLDSVIGSCRTEFVDGPEVFDFRMTFPNETSMVSWDVSSFVITFTGLRDCMAGGGNAPCDIVGDTFQNAFCWDLGCGICQCEETVSAMNVDASWRKENAEGAPDDTGTVLSIGTGGLGATKFDYCVRGDTLELRDQLADTRYSLARVALP